MRRILATRLGLSLMGIAAVVLVQIALGVHGFWVEYASFRDAPSPVDHEPAHRTLPRLLEVRVPSPSGALAGWFVPGAPGAARAAAVVLVHGSGGSRAELLPEIQILSAAGFSCLAFDWPGEGESEGLVQWGAYEMAALRSVVDWLRARPDVDGARIGAFGFSLGSWILLREAASDERIRAVAVAGAPASMVEFSLWDGPPSYAAKWGAIYAMRARGMPIGTDEPADVVKRLPPRPLLVVAGENDTTVPPAMSRALFDAARQPKELVTIPGAGHGEYAQKSRALYADRLASFFSAALR